MTSEFFAHRDIPSAQPLICFHHRKLSGNLAGKFTPRLPGTSNLRKKPTLTFSQRMGRWCLAVFLLLFWVVPVKAHVTHPHVVIVSSYHQGYEWSDKTLAGLLDSLHQLCPQMDPAIEYLDAKRFPGRDQAERMQGYLAGKYRGQKIDLVVVLDNPALNLVINFRQDLFPGVPLVFAGINDFAPAMLKGRQKVTGAAEVLDYADTLDLAMSLHPTAKEVLVIHDYTITGLAEAQEMQKVARAFKGRVEVSFTPPAAFQEILEQLQSLPPGSIGLITGLATDRRGISLGLAESTRMLAAAGVPLYALHETRLGHGIVGGYLLEGREHGRRAGQLALKILAGEDPSRIPVITKSTAKPMFDYQQLTRFGIYPEALPQGSVVINRPVSFYSQNKKWIWGVSAITVFLSLVIFILGTNIMRRHKAEQKVKDLAKFPEENPNPVLRVSREGVILYANQASKALLELWDCEVGQPLPGDWRDQVLKSLDAASGQEMELTCNSRSHLLTLAPIVDMGYLNIYVVDITARKRAEEKILASLKEKEVLLKEIHHRVKNNLQIISTLLALQIKHRSTQDPAELFQDCQNRIRSMALIHESLYSTEDLANINFRTYLAKLSARLLASYGSLAQGIKISTAGSNVLLDVSQAVPCGLIANELLVNALKHAFPGRDGGEIQLSIEEAAGRRVLEVRDNGQGLGPDSDPENPTTFGWMMVKNLAKQLGGDFTVHSNGGTSCRIAF